VRGSRFGRRDPGHGLPMPAERDESREPEEIVELVDEFGDRSGPDPTREPELELGDDEVIVEPAADDDA
jgi:hypothetical protein